MPKDFAWRVESSLNPKAITEEECAMHYTHFSSFFGSHA